MLQPIPSQNPYAPARVVLGAVIFAGSGALAAALFTTTGPLGGALFGAASFLSGRLINWTCENTECLQDSTVGKVARYVLSIGGGIAIGAVALKASGIPLTFITGITLTSGMVAVMSTAVLVIAALILSIATAIGLALGRAP